MERFNESSGSPEETRQKKKTPFRFMKGVELHIATSLGKIEVFGKENLDAILPDAKVIIAVSHISDLDLPAAIKVLGNDFDIVVTAQSQIFNFVEDPVHYAVTKIAGMDNFLPVDYAKTKEGKRPEFNPDNFVSMSQALDDGKEIVIAAHNPTKNGALGSGSVGPIYLAQISGAIILPVSVNLKTEEALGIDGKNKLKTMLKRPDAEVHIGKPVSLPSLEGIEHIKEILDKRKQGKEVTAEEKAEFSSAVAALRIQSDIVMNELAEMLPESKRGEYGVEEKNN